MSESVQLEEGLTMLKHHTRLSDTRPVVEPYTLAAAKARARRRRAIMLVGVASLSVGSVIVSPSFAHAAPAASGMIGLQQGSRGDAVRSLQQALVSAGVKVTGGVDGIFGVGTAAAVKQFQSAKGLSATGVVDEATASALAGTAPAAVPSSPLFGLKIGATGDAVRQLQATLVARGFKIKGDADGTFGVNTVNALASFQYSQRIKVNGRVDEATLAALGTPAPVPAAAPAPAAPAAPRSSRRARCSG